MSILAPLFSCCLRPRVEDDHTVIPTETTNLISHASRHSSNGLVDTTAVDRQKLHDRMGIIVRSKEGKMVNVNLRTPFILGSAPASPPSTGRSSPLPSPLPPASSESASTSSHATVPNGTRTPIPQILTMTPARMRLRADSRYSSPSGSRSSSLRRPDTADRSPTVAQFQLRPTTPLERPPPRVPNPSSEGIGEREVELESPASQLGEAVAIAVGSPVRRDEASGDAGDGIAFSWGDT
ncbi:hypothetical protein B0H14DRAFT_173960 [Mycena olivaceomarginata]|nr:hypothetical protein B0H14DRAFT_173960 [Mycena olivaceomarginata]